MIFSKIISFIMVIFYTFGSAFAAIPKAVWYGDREYKVTDSENILLNVAMIADTHSDSKYFDKRSKMLRKIMCGISQTDSIPDAMIIAGDISNATDPKEYKSLERSIRTFNKIENIIPAAGNHDVRASDTYEEAQKYFSDFAAFCGIQTDKTYYTTTVKGYRFIVLGSEGQLSLEPYISDEQVAWLEAQLIEAQKTEKPIFIICHQAMYNSNNVLYHPEAEDNWGIGDNSDKIEAVIRKYVPSYKCPVFFISGHLHRSFNENSFDSNFCDNLYCISLPSVAKTDNGGLGVAIEVYPDCIFVRARNYLTMEQYKKYEYIINY